MGETHNGSSRFERGEGACAPANNNKIRDRRVREKGRRGEQGWGEGRRDTHLDQDWNEKAAWRCDVPTGTYPPSLAAVGTRARARIVAWKNMGPRLGKVVGSRVGQGQAEAVGS